jgi:hypothetical protein
VYPENPIETLGLDWVCIDCGQAFSNIHDCGQHARHGHSHFKRGQHLLIIDKPKSQQQDKQT